MEYIFGDESGQFNKKEDSHFIIAVFSTSNPAYTAKQFRKWYRSKFPKYVRYQTEVKSKRRGISDDLILRTLKEIIRYDIRIAFSVLSLNDIPYTYWKKKRLQSGLLYTQMVSKTIKLLFPIQQAPIHIVFDHRKLGHICQDMFRAMIKGSISEYVPFDVEKSVYVETKDSAGDINIQIADWIVGALARYVKQKPLGNEGYEILKQAIVGRYDMFRESKNPDIYRDS